MRTRVLSAVPLFVLLTAWSPTGGDSTAAQNPDVDAARAALPQGVKLGELLPTGARITPDAARGSMFRPLNPQLPGFPNYVVDHAVTTALSPDRATLLVLTSGYNRMNDAAGKNVAAASTEHVFVFDVRSGRAEQRQVLQVPNTFIGLAWDPRGQRFYVSGGVDDSLHVYDRVDGQFGEVVSIPLGHSQGLGLGTDPMAAGVAVNANGTRAVVANYENDSLSIVDLSAQRALFDVDLRPGKQDPSRRGEPGGSYPFSVVFKGNTTVYVSSQRDNEVLAVQLSDASALVVGRRSVGGQPNKLLLNRDQSRLFVANANSDSVSILDTGSLKVLSEINTTAPKLLFWNGDKLHGANPNGLALSPDEKTLYVTNGGTNAVAVIRLAADRLGPRVVGLIPTGWYPNDLAVSADGAHLFVVNGKGNAGPNPGACRNVTSTASDALAGCNAANQYVWQQEKAGFLTLPTPDTGELSRLSWQVAFNNQFPLVANHLEAEQRMRALSQRIKHVVYVIKENRTYDQIFGDLEGTNADPSLTLFPEPISPNHHAVASGFVALDNFLDSGETSGVGWNWTLAARTTDSIEKTQPVNYAGRGLTYDWEGTNRNINVGLPTAAERHARNPAVPDDPDLLAGTADVASHAVPEHDVAEYLWDAALQKGLSVRNYGCFGEIPPEATLDPNPFATGSQQLVPAKPSLRDVTDLYFRGYDQRYPDYYRYKEWEREFDGYVSAGKLPSLQLVRFSHDHFGSFSTAIAGVNTPDTQMADNDYSVGLLIEKIAHSPFQADTLVFVIEDDAQNGPDHVDAHRSLLLVAGAFVKQQAVVSDAYNTVNVVRTIEDALGLNPMGLTDGLAAPMANLFDLDRDPRGWSYRAVVPEVLRTTALPLPPSDATVQARAPKPTMRHPRRDAAYWTKVMRGQNFAREDALDTDRFNRALWRGLMGSNAPYPTHRHGRDLTVQRADSAASN
jgi:YVTN family beta-propeller protein